MRKKAQGVGSILRKSEERERYKYMSWKDVYKSDDKPTHIIKKIKNVDGSIVGYVECMDKSIVRVPIKKLEALLFFGVGNEDYVANGMEKDMLRTEKASKEIRKQIENAISEARGEVVSETNDNIELSPRIVNGKIISMNLCTKKGDKND